jgi:branched-chain amino acid transport system ATP-binding protein
MLSVCGLQAGYGSGQVLQGIDLQIAAGEVVTLLGRNGMGKTTTVKTIMGLLRASDGDVEFAGKRLRGLPSYQIARQGIGLVPEGRQIFPNLTAREQLLATAANRHAAPQPWNETAIYRLFPRLAERRHHYGNQLSGGEQQMLAIGRALMTNPRLLILDEACEGLAPLIRAEIWQCLDRLKASGLAILVIDKNLSALQQLADRHYLIEKGRVVWSGHPEALANTPDLQHRYLGLHTD